MPAPRIRWGKIKGLVTGRGQELDDLALFILPVAGRDLLMSIINRLEWKATYRIDDYDYADWDDLQRVAQLTIDGLMGDVMLADMITNLDRIATALENNLCCTQDELTAINNTIANLNLTCIGGGGGGGNTLKEWRVPTDWENDWNESPIPESTIPTSETMGTLCDNAYSAHWEIANWFQQFQDNVSSISPYDDLAQEIDEFALNNPYTSWVWSLMNVVVALWYDELLTDVASFWESIKMEFICKVVELDNGQDLKSWTFTRIRTNPPTWSAGFYMETLLTGTLFSILYDGTYTPFPQFLGSDCAACTPLVVEEIEPGFFLVPVTVSQNSPSVNGGTVTNIGGNLWNFQGGANGGAQIWPDITSFGYDFNINGGTSRMGFMVQVQSVSSAVWFMQSTTQVFHSSSSSFFNDMVIKGYDSINASDIQTWAETDADETNFADGANGSYFRIIQNGGLSGQSCNVYIWVVVDQNAQL